MEKARLTKAQAEALEHARISFGSIERIVHLHAKGANDGEEWGNIFSPLNEVGMDAFCRALYIGYETIENLQVVTVTEQTKKDIRELFASDKGNATFEMGFSLGVTRVLQLTGITIKGINA